MVPGKFLEITCASEAIFAVAHRYRTFPCFQKDGIMSLGCLVAALNCWQ